MYSSIIKTKALPGDWLVIPGAGGGLGHMYVLLFLAECLPLQLTHEYVGVCKSRPKRDSRSWQLTSQLTFLSMIHSKHANEPRYGGDRKELCLSLGATEFLDFSKVDTVAAVKSSTSGLGAHAEICTANGEQAYEQSLQMLRPLGVLVCVGIPNRPFKLPATPFDMMSKVKT